MIQPKLSDLLFKYRGKIEESIHDKVVWGRLVKRETMLKAYKLLGSEICNKFWLRFTDIIVSYALFKVANSYKNIKFIVIYILWGNKKYQKTEVTQTTYKKDMFYSLYYLIEALLNIIKYD